jgi:hypothetical protein
MVTTLEQPFTAPSAEDGANEPTGAIPVGLIAVAVVIALGGLVSIVAFRGDRRPAG